jgi:iron complex transport system ATP-binding protein
VAEALAGKPSVLEAIELEWSVRGRRILRGVDLAIGRGECVAIVGPNGAGKTSFLRLASGLVQPSAGEIRLSGESLTTLPRREIARRIAYVPQLRPNRIPLSVEQMVLLGRYPHWTDRRIAPGAEDFEAVRGALARVGLDELRRRQMERLSGGEQQRVFLAACLAQESETLVLDEPTTHLDPRHQGDVAELIVSLSREAERTIVCATHDLNFASLIADRVIGLRNGVIVASGAPAEVLDPGTLRQLFDADFEIFSGGERPMTVLRLEGR